MADRKELGKIKSVYFGHGGYQDACIGIHFTLGGDGWGVGDNRSAWDEKMIQCGERTKWTEQDRSAQYDEIMRYISALLSKAKVHDLNNLVGIPVEVIFDGMALKSWRVLTEVL